MSKDNSTQAGEAARQPGKKAPGKKAPTKKVSAERKPGPEKSAAGRQRRGIVTGLLSAGVLLAAGAGVVSAAAVLPGPAGSRTLEAGLSDVPAGRSTMVCPGPAVLPEGTAGTDAQFSPVSRTAKNSLDALVLSDATGALPGSRVAALDGSGARTVSEAPKETPAPAPGPPALKAATVAQSAGKITVLNAEPSGNQQAAMAAVGSYSASDGDLRGLATAQCQQPSNDFWLLGADTTLGRTALLNLSNASGTPATVNLELLGTKGRIQSPGSRGLLVPPHSSRTINLAGLAADEENLSLHVRSSGGPVAATVQQSVLRGLVSGGVEHLAPGTAPADSQVMTAVVVQDPKTIKALSSKSGFADAVPALEVTVPGAADAVLDVKLYGPNGPQSLSGGGAVTAKAGSVTEIPLTGVPAGTYTVSATSDVPFAAAARLLGNPRESAPMDFGWSPAAVRLGSQHVVAVPRNGVRFLSFGVPDGRATVSYTPVTSDGKLGNAESVDIAGGTTTVIGVPAKDKGPAVVGYVVAASGDPAYGAVLLGEKDGPGISTIAIQQGPLGHEKVAVTLGY